MGNLLSVKRALEHCGALVTVTADPKTILAAPRVVLPGVGAFADGMREMKRRQLDLVVREIGARGVPLLGICLGMQMLLEESEEFGRSAGLGLLPGSVVVIPTTTFDGGTQKIPHLGWNSLSYAPGRTSWKGTPLEDVNPGEAVYFVHSFMASPSNSALRVADCFYGAVPVSAAIGRDNIFGCQFHPEKSGETGLKILKRFLE